MSNEAALDIVNQWRKAGHKIYMTSGGFDPLHIGHLRCIQGTARLAEDNNGKVLVLVNGDQFLIDKKGQPFMENGMMAHRPSVRLSSCSAQMLSRKVETETIPRLFLSGTLLRK
jgi:cytidyltransferase-like protein